VLGFMVMSKHLDSLISQLHADGSLKVWSLIITFFGDSIVNRGGNVSASSVHTVLERVDIGSGAVRTAFSRLVSDGWIERQKLGRRSYYQLTGDGMSLFSDAAQRIYSPVESAKNTQSPETWLLGMHADKSILNRLSVANAILLPNRCVLVFNPDKRAAKAISKLGLLSITGQLNAVPEWLVEHLRPADWERQIQTLQNRFRKVAITPPTDPLSALAARTLLIHQWRRLLLRYPPIPGSLKGHSLQVENQSRRFVGDLYHSLSKRAESWLIEQGSCMEGALPKARTHVADRFTHRYPSISKAQSPMKPAF